MPATATTLPGRVARLLHTDLVRSAKAVPHLTTYVVAAVSTVLLTRVFLALTGYPQIGGGTGLHIAHVLPGGLLMLLAHLLQLAWIGPGPRPLAALLGGVGFGLFIDEVGKFVTSTNDYFYEPAFAIMYVVLAAVVVGAHRWRRRRPLDADERVANAAHVLVDGLAGRLPESRRQAALRSLDRAGDSPAAEDLRRLLSGVPTSAPGVPHHVEEWSRSAARAFDRVSGSVWALPAMAALLALQALTATVVVVGGWDGSFVPVLGVLVGAGVSVGLVLVGLWRARHRGRRAAVASFQRSALASLLITQVFLFATAELAATGGLLVDLVLLGLTSADLARDRRDSPAAL